MNDHKIHDRLPSGFRYADRMQSEQFEATGSINGASKVCLVRAHIGPTETVEVAYRLRPPRTLDEIRSNLGRGAVSSVEAYRSEYNRGWYASHRGGGREWESGYSNHAYDDGYLDAAFGRAKWHLTWCVDHDACGEG